jgi:hypothetical protein
LDLDIPMSSIKMLDEDVEYPTISKDDYDKIKKVKQKRVEKQEEKKVEQEY